MAETVETTATEVPATPAPEVKEETLEQRVARVTAEVNDYLLKNGLQLQVEHRVILSQVKKAE